MTVIAANPAFRAAFGFAQEEVVGEGLFELGRGQWDIPGLRSLLEELLPQESELRECEVEGDFAGLGRRTVIVNARELLAEGGTRRFILLSAEDVTERRADQRRLEHYARELERSNRELQDFAHAASHDLQEPLRKIRTYADRVLAALESVELDERTRVQLRRMEEAAHRMQRRIDDLLQLARVSRTAPEYARVDLSSVVAEVLDDMEISLQRHRAEVEVGELPVLEADPAQLRLLFQNLIANSLKFARTGEAPVVRIHTLDPPDAVVGANPRSFVVEDEGIGFEAQYAERIFEPFQRLHGQAEYEGSGVGLAICRRIVEHHHGAVRAEGRPGQGARFIVTLPAEQAPPVAEGA